MNTKGAQGLLGLIGSAQGADQTELMLIAGVGGLALLFLLLGVVYLIGGSRSSRAAYEGQLLDQEVKAKIDQLGEQMRQTVREVRGEFDQLKYELEDIRTKIADNKVRVAAQSIDNLVDIKMGQEKTAGSNDLFDFEL